MSVLNISICAEVEWLKCLSRGVNHTVKSLDHNEDIMIIEKRIRTQVVFNKTKQQKRKRKSFKEINPGKQTTLHISTFSTQS